MENHLKAEQKKLVATHQEHLLAYWDTLLPDERKHLLQQLHHLDFNFFKKQQEILRKQALVSKPFSPLKDYHFANSSTDVQRGKELLTNGKMGCLIIAGGQASRLRLSSSKGIVKVTPIKEKSLFQLFAEKTLAASREAGISLPLAIMTSPLNHEEVINFFQMHHFFGLDSSQISFFQQEMLPLLDEKGNLFLETSSSLSQGPNGNGDALHLFYRSGIWQQWIERGIQYLNFIQIDNPLADPFDAELLGFHFSKDNHITIKCTMRNDPKEKVGVLVEQEGRVAVVEYSEFPPQELEARRKDGTLVHLCANLSLFCFDMDWIRQVALSSEKLPLHLAHKAAKVVVEDGKTVLSPRPNAWKFEKFIFDLLRFSSKTGVLIYPRERCYAPLKNQEGADSIETVRQALQSIDYHVYHQISGTQPPPRLFELAQEFHYPTPDLLQKWRGRPLPEASYIEP